MVTVDPISDPNIRYSTKPDVSDCARGGREALECQQNYTGRHQRAPTPATFKTGALNHSATLPSLEFRDLAICRGRRKPQLSPDCHRQQIGRASCRERV